jgi:DNA-binding transcriptional MerR regulator
MDKSPEAFRTISEVAETLDVPPHVLRFWETRFTQVKPVKRGGGRRYYRPEDVRLLRGIRGLLYDDGMTIKGVQKILRERGVRHVIGLGTEPEAEAPVEAAPPAAEAAPAPAARTRPAPKPRQPADANGRGPEAPQPDLFAPAEEGAAAVTATVPIERAAAATGPLDKPALRALVAELEALRAVMIAKPRR